MFTRPTRKEQRADKELKIKWLTFGVVAASGIISALYGALKMLGIV
jgi:hypothetical protein